VTFEGKLLNLCAALQKAGIAKCVYYRHRRRCAG
jgi:hypothetical protein